MNFPKKQLQLSQLELIFKGPLVKDSIVNSLSDLRVKPRRSGRGCKRGRHSLPFFGL